jgi:hypothetical protein
MKVPIVRKRTLSWRSKRGDLFMGELNDFVEAKKKMRVSGSVNGKNDAKTPVRHPPVEDSERTIPKLTVLNKWMVRSKDNKDVSGDDQQGSSSTVTQSAVRHRVEDKSLAEAKNEDIDDATDGYIGNKLVAPRSKVAKQLCVKATDSGEAAAAAATAAVGATPSTPLPFDPNNPQLQAFILQSVQTIMSQMAAQQQKLQAEAAVVAAAKSTLSPLPPIP